MSVHICIEDRHEVFIFRLFCLINVVPFQFKCTLYQTWLMYLSVGFEATDPGDARFRDACGPIILTSIVGHANLLDILLKIYTYIPVTRSHPEHKSKPYPSQKIIGGGIRLCTENIQR